MRSSSTSFTCEDITVAWGRRPHAQDSVHGYWRLAVYQDVQEAFDGSRLYFLYDPKADRRSVASGARRAGVSLVAFDLELRCFVGNIPFFESPGAPKFLFALKNPSPSGGSSFVLVSETKNQDGSQLHVFRLDLTANGMELAEYRSLLQQPLSVSSEYICTLREDVPQLVVLAGPGLQVWQVDAMAPVPSTPLQYSTVPGAELTHFYDGFVCRGYGRQ